MARIKDDQKIEQIYQATLELVLKSGFSGLKMADVAAQAGLATGTVYIYFKDKDKLINELYLHLKNKFAGEYWEGVDEEETYKKSFRRAWKQYFQFSLENSAEAAFLEQYYRSPYFKSGSRKDNVKLQQPLFDLLERGKEVKKLKKLNTELLLAQAVGPVNELIRHHQYGTLKATPAVMESAFDLVWESLKR